jgi:hypothetical protein
VIGTKALRDLADRHPDDPEFANLLHHMAARREREFDAKVLAPLIFRRHLDIPDGETWDEQDPQVRDRVTELVAIIRGRLEELGWRRPDIPGRSWERVTDIPEGVPFEDQLYGGRWVREGDIARSLTATEPQTYRADSFENGEYREVLPA